MNSKGRLAGMTKDWRSGKLLVTFQLDTDVSEALLVIGDETLDITAKIYHEHRSLNANAYYHVLLAKVADAMCISKTRAHNLMLRDFGQPFIIDGCTAYIMIPDTDEAEEMALEAETFHIKPTDNTAEGEDGKRYRIYELLRGSHDYDSYEMAKLINGLVSQAKELGIETLTPEQLQEMFLKYG